MDVRQLSLPGANVDIQGQCGEALVLDDRLKPVQRLIREARLAPPPCTIPALRPQVVASRVSG